MNGRTPREIGSKGHVADGCSSLFLAKFFVGFHQVLADVRPLQKFPRGLQILLGTGKVAGAEFDPAKGVPVRSQLQHERKIGSISIFQRNVHGLFRKIRNSTSGVIQGFGKVNIGLGECVCNVVEVVRFRVIPKALLQFRHRLLHIGNP